MLIFFRGLLLVIVGLYLALFVVALFFSNRMMFHPKRAGYRDTDEIIKLKSADGATISALYLANPNATFTILYSHGNAEDIGDDAPLFDSLRAAGFAVFAYDYQGYGTSEGTPTERHACEDADAAYDYLVGTLHVPPERIIAFGRSLGGGVATDLASRRPVAGLVLESTFTTAFRVMTRISLLPFDRFDNVHKIKLVHCPVLVIHGTRDMLIHIALGQQLYDAANKPKLFLWVEGAGHNDVPYFAGKKYFEALHRLSELIGEQQAGKGKDAAS